MGSALAQEAYLKASNPDKHDLFGYRVVLSADGLTLAVRAYREASAATGIDGDQADDSAPEAGAVYVFARSGTTWSQQAYVKASNTDPGDRFGESIALSADGSILVVGAPRESSAATGIGGDQANNSRPSAGAVYVFTRSGTTWAQQAYVKASNPDATDVFGIAVALSADGSTLAVGASSESSAASGIDGDQSDNSLSSAGAVYVFTRSGTAWSQQTYVKASNPGPYDRFGQGVALSADGSTLAVSAPTESSAATGIGGPQADNSAYEAGAVYVFARSGATWSQQAYVKASNTGPGDWFGAGLALSSDGSTLAVGAPNESSAAAGIGGDQTDDSVYGAGAVYVFARSGAMWSQQAYVKASNPGWYHALGSSGAVALSSDGSTLVAGASGESSAAVGVGGDQADQSAGRAGAAYLFRRGGTTWTQQAYLKASNTGALDAFGCSVALSADGSSIAAGAHGEASAIPPHQDDNSAGGAGAVYVFR